MSGWRRCALVVLVLTGMAAVAIAAGRMRMQAATSDSWSCGDDGIDAAISLPGDAEIRPVGADVPAELAAFSGMWCGSWSADAATALVVEAVTPPTATVIYAHGAIPRAGRAPVSGDWWRAPARFEGTTLWVRPYPELLVSYTPRADGTLEAAFGTEQPVGSAILHRADRSVPAGEPSREFDGIYTTMFEVSAFSEGTDCAGDRNAYWLEAADGRSFYDQVAAFRAAQPDRFRQAPFGRYHIRFVGHASRPGHYGHLGGYRQQVTVERLLDISAAECDP